MKIEEFYKKVGGNYNEVLSRLMNDKLILKFVLKFKSDDTYKSLSEALNNKDYKTAFRAAHTMKGVCSTLGFQDLFSVSSELTEVLRKDEIDLDYAETLFNKLKETYFFTIELINSIE
jgi:HPt (histidine-containing phosphotransfer) domain-containing protein